MSKLLTIAVLGIALALVGATVITVSGELVFAFDNVITNNLIKHHEHDHVKVEAHTSRLTH
jgi:hypothetical protein